MIGFDISESYEELYLSLNYKYSNKLIKNHGTGDWESTSMMRISLTEHESLKDIFHDYYDDENDDDDDELESILEKKIAEVVQEIASVVFKEIGNGRFNVSKKGIIGYNFHDSDFYLLKQFRIKSQFREAPSLVVRMLDTAWADTNPPEAEVLLENVSIYGSLRNVKVKEDYFEIVRSKHYKSPHPMFCLVLLSYYEKKNDMAALKELVEYSIDKEGMPIISILGAASTLGLKTDQVIGKLRKLHRTSWELYHKHPGTRGLTDIEFVSRLLVELAGDDPALYFAYCPACSKKLASRVALTCISCGFKWYECPGCGEKWIRGAKVCSKCGHDLYAAQNA